MTDPAASGARPLTSRKEIFGISAAVVAGLLVLLLPRPAGLPFEGQRAAVLMVVCLILWFTEALPIAMTSLVALGLQPILGVASIGTAFTSFISSVFFFVISGFIIAYAFSCSGLAQRFALWLLARAGTDSRRVLFALMAGTAAVSTVVSDVPTTALFMTMALGILDRMGVRPLESNFGKAMMMGIPIAALIGGVGTPAGTSINILGIGLIEQMGKVHVPFLHWMAIGMPMVIVLIPVAWRALLFFFPPEMAAIGQLQDVALERAALGPMRPAEVKVLVVQGAMLVLWIASTWVKGLDVALIAVLGAVTLFLPGMGLFTWREVERHTGWDVLLMIGGVTSLGAASAKTGLAKWMVDVAFGGLAHTSPLTVVALISAFTVLAHLALPIAPVIVVVLVPPIIVLAQQAGANPALYALPVVFTASCAFILPLDAVVLLTYSRGYYRMGDMIRTGLAISAVWVVLITALLMLVGPRVGFF